MGRCYSTKELHSIPACIAVWVPSSYTDHYLILKTENPRNNNCGNTVGRHGTKRRNRYRAKSENTLPVYNVYFGTLHCISQIKAYHYYHHHDCYHYIIMTVSHCYHIKL